MNRFVSHLNSQSGSTATPHDEIELWSVDLDAVKCSEKRAHALLSTEECDRALRFRNAVHRQSYLIRRAILRILLGRYLGCQPESIPIAYGARGKPFLPGVGLHFNLSHSGTRVCFAFNSESPLGIDLERIRIVPDLLHTADGFCSPQELAALESLPKNQRDLAFLRCWTSKEAIVKASGQGLSYPVRNFSVAFDKSGWLLDSSSKDDELGQWYFHSWEPGAGYVGAVVSRHAEHRIVSRRFDFDWI